MNKQTNTNEEVDLGSLFVIIGKGFAKFFSSIRKLFQKIFNSIIYVLLFLRSNVVKISIGAFLGAILGFALEFLAKDKFEASLQLQPNFESSRQLYNGVGYYDDLVKQQDTLLLAKVFGISTSEAASLKRFHIAPIKNENDILDAFDELVKRVDTTTVKSYSYLKFKNMFTDYDYNIQKITVVSTKNNVFRKLTNTIIKSITDNDYFKKVKDISNKNLLRSDQLIKKNLLQTDSLHEIYKKVLLAEAKKTTTGTNINTGNSQSKDKELELFETNRKLNKDLSLISKKIAEKSAIVNVISDFQPIGHKVDDISKNKMFQFGLLGSFLVIGLLLVVKLNRFLTDYQK